MTVLAEEFGYSPFIIAAVGAVVLFILGLACWWITRVLDKDRLRDHLRSQGNDVLRIRRSYFGPGWLGERNARIYWVQYRDLNGDLHEVYCKTSMLAGVYITSGAPPAAPPKGDPYAELQKENRRLREEVDSLKKELSER